MTPVQRFARVLRAPDVARLLGAAVLARMPIGIDSLGMVLFVRAETGSFARAGLVAAAFGLGDRRARHRPWAGSSTTTRTRGSCSRWRPCTRPRWEGSSPWGWRARRRARWWPAALAGRRQLPAGRLGRATAARAACSAARTDAAAHRLRARRHRHRAGLRHRPAAHRGDRRRRLARRRAAGRLRLRAPRHGRARHLAGVARLAARTPASTSATCSARSPRRACAPSSPRRPRSASPWAPPR